MFGFLGFILIFILVIVLFAVALLGNLIRAILGLGRRTPKQSYSNNSSASQESSYSFSRKNSENFASNKKKIFADDEGEYVEYEEVK